MTTSRQTALMLGYAGEAISIVPVHAAADYETKEYCCRPFGNESMKIERDIYYLRNTRLSAVAQLFVEFYVKYMKIQIA